MQDIFDDAQLTDEQIQLLGEHFRSSRLLLYEI